MKIPEVARRARRRLFWNEVLAEGTCALSVGLGAVVLLLVLGTQLLDWRWLILLPAATLSIGVYRTSRKLPGLYPAAQIIDRRLNLADSISTALYFTESASADRAAAHMLQGQLAQAEILADRVDREAGDSIHDAARRVCGGRAGLRRQQPVRAALRTWNGVWICGSRWPASSSIPSAAARHQDSRPCRRKEPRGKRSALQEAMGISTEDGTTKGPGDLDAAPDSALETTGDSGYRQQ